MDPLVAAVLGVVAIVAVNSLAPRVGVAAPLVLVLLGVGVSFLPFVPAIEVEPEWILGVVLPPLLYSSAVSMPTMDFRRDFRIISTLSVVLVVVSAVVVGFVVSWLVPDVGLAAGIALGAIVSPTDAVATSIVRRAGVSPRIVTVLEGESMLNDASALVVLRAAIGVLPRRDDGEEEVGDRPNLPAIVEEVRSLRLALIIAERAALLRIRDVGTYRSSVLDDALVQLDAAEIGIRLREQRD
jgi:NhaP-type Na+/H+ or K+/H+ antiporter